MGLLRFLPAVSCVLVLTSGVVLNANPNVPNPDVPCWIGESASTEGEEGFVGWYTTKGERPYLITHDRDQFRQHGELEVDYNFIVYWFGNPASPIQARHYLGENEVSLILPLPTQEGVDLERAKQAIPGSVLCYLQTRFSKIVVLTAKGYEVVWKLELPE